MSTWRASGWKFHMKCVWNQILANWERFAESFGDKLILVHESFFPLSATKGAAQDWKPWRNRTRTPELSRSTVVWPPDISHRSQLSFVLFRTVWTGFWGTYYLGIHIKNGLVLESEYCWFWLTLHNGVL